MFDTSYSASNILIENAPVKQVKIGRGKTSAGKQSFDKAINLLTPGDVFTLRNSHGSLNDGLYLVNLKDDVNKGVNLTRLEDDEFSPLQTNNLLVTADDVEGTVEIAGSLNVVA